MNLKFYKHNTGICLPGEGNNPSLAAAAAAADDDDDDDDNTLDLVLIYIIQYEKHYPS
jgi:hypothetical protein